MLIKAKSLKGYKLLAKDGEIGKVDEFFFDDQHWVIRYLVADTGNWLAGHQVLLAPYALGEVTKEEEHVAVNLTKKQIEDSPTLESALPISRQYEENYYGYYGWPTYWSGSYIWGMYPNIVRDPMMWGEIWHSEKKLDAHLRSTDVVDGYHIEASDGAIGHIDDFIVDDETWAIRYLVVDTTNFLPGKKVLVSPQWVERMSWQDEKVFIKLSKDAIKRSPQYSEKSPIIRDYEVALHRHYGRRGYWADDKAA